jgi:hypothetical protein
MCLRVVAALALVAGLLVPVSMIAARSAQAATCPCSIWSSTASPATPADSDTAAVEVGVKFQSDQDGSISGIRFYKGTGNSGTHIGHLWTSAGTLLATATFSGETATGWQQVLFGSAVAITAGTTYVASYYAPNGRYAGDAGFFAAAGVDNAPLHALRDGADGGNGVYRYGTGGGFPTSTWQSANYWVDVVFNPAANDTTPPTVTSHTPASGATGVPTTTTVTATFNEAVQPATIQMQLAAGTTTVTGGTTYDSATRTATFTPSAALAASTSYTATVSGAKDLAGNTMATVSWSFTTSAGGSGCPCTIWPDTATPATPKSTTTPPLSSASGSAPRPPGTSPG